MSFSSTPYKLNKNVKQAEKIKKTHLHHSEILDQMTQQVKLPEKINAKAYENIQSGNYIYDRQFCSLEPNKFGSISGCSVAHQDVYREPKPDFVDRISEDGFSSQFFKTHYGKIGQEELKVSKNNLGSRSQQLKFSPLPGLEMKKGLQLDKVDGIPEAYMATDPYSSYVKNTKLRFPMNSK